MGRRSRGGRPQRRSRGRLGRRWRTPGGRRGAGRGVRGRIGAGRSWPVALGGRFDCGARAQGVSRRGERSTSAVGGRGRWALGMRRRPSRGLCGGGCGGVWGHVFRFGGRRLQGPGALGGAIPEDRSGRAVGCPGGGRRSGFHCPTLGRRGVGLGVSSSEFEAITDHDPRSGGEGSRGLGLNSGARRTGGGRGTRPLGRSAEGDWGSDGSVLGGCPARTGMELGNRGDRRGRLGWIKPNSGDGKPAVGVGRTQFRGWEAGCWVEFRILSPIAEGSRVVLASDRGDRRRRLGGLGARPG
jgi:hypothetical protein